MNVPRPIGLVHVQRPSVEISAGWLASSDPLAWLGEIAHARRHGCRLAAYPVAVSAADPRAVGVLLVPKDGTVASFRPRVTPLVEILPGVHASHDADLPVGLLPNERAYFFPYPLHFFHPSHGLVGFEAKDEISPAKLLTLRERQAAEWNWAVPAPESLPVLISIVIAILAEAAEEFLKDAALEIGDKAGSSSDALSMGKKLLGPIANLALGVAGGGLLGLAWLLAKIPGFPGGIEIPGDSGPPHPGGSPDKTGKGTRLLKWAEKRWKELLDHRQREIDRLMKLMEENPEEGLRYALPLTGSGAGRGKAPLPGWRLGLRKLNFQMGGSGPADVWDIENETRLALERRYREAAQRERELGRHDRAAYILGNLLGDWNGAAQALAAAGRHREAVAIYLNKLNNRAAAARCLVEAGLLAQAAHLYFEHKEFEKAGDLHAQLGNEGEARRLWQLAVDAESDVYEKARLHLEKLRDPDAAMEEWRQAWKSGNRPAIAIERMFKRLGEANDAESSLKLLGQIVHESPSVFALIDRLRSGIAEWERRPEDPAFRKAVEDHVYREIGHRFVSDQTAALPLLSLLPRLDPGDRLLERDAKRYAISKRKIETHPRKYPKGVTRKPRVIKIPGTGRWQSLAWIREGVSVAGLDQGVLTIAQLRDNQCHVSSLRTVEVPREQRFVRHLGVVAPRAKSHLFHLPGEGCLHYRAMDRARSQADDAVGDLRGILAAGLYGSGDEFMLLHRTATGSLSASIYSEPGELRRTLPIDYAPPEVDGLNWRCAGKGGHLCFTAEGFFAWRHPDGRFDSMALDDHPGHLHLSPVVESVSVLLPRRQEVILLEAGKPGKPPETINLHSNPASRDAPVACFTRDGQIVIGHENGGMVYAPGKYLEPVQELWFPGDAGKLVDACALGPDGFVFLTSEGHLLVFA